MQIFERISQKSKKINNEDFDEYNENKQIDRIQENLNQETKDKVITFDFVKIWYLWLFFLFKGM